MKERTKKRSFYKAVTWRIIGTLDTLLVCFVLTGSLKTSGCVVGVELLTKSLMYYAHERVWNKIKIK